MKLEDVLNEFNRVAIVGAPGVGKTTLAATRGDFVSTGDYESAGWRSSGIEALAAVLGRERYVVEGVTACHAVRANPKAFDAVIFMQLPKHERWDPAIAKGCHTVLDGLDVPIIYELNCES